MKAIPYGKQHITKEDIKAVIETLQSDFLTQGPKIDEFEKAFAQYIGAKYAVAVSNGTAALHLCALALGVKKGDNVITSPITFAASANCIRYCEGNVYLADIDASSYLIDINRIKDLLAHHPKGTFKGIVPVDFAGAAVNMEEIKQIADENNLWIIEDACHAPGAYFTDSKGIKQACGNCAYADLAIFSFHPVKHIATGEGGMITTNNGELYKKLLLLRTHGITKEKDLMTENHGGWYYEMLELGFNYRLTDIQAALGLSQLKRADEGLKRRREIAAIYANAFSEFSAIKTGDYVNGHGYHLYIIEINNRLGLYNYLREQNIFAQVHYIPVHMLPYYKNLLPQPNHFPIAENYYKHCISLPMYPSLTNQELQYVIEKVLTFLSSN